MRVFMKSARFGGAVALFVEAEDSVHQILAKAHILTQQPIDRLQLAYRGMLLHGPDRLATYGIEEDSILLVTKKTRMTVRWLETWQEYSYEGFAWTTVFQLKAMLCFATGVNIQEVRIVHDREVLGDAVRVSDLASDFSCRLVMFAPRP